MQVVKNYLYNASYQVFVLLVPLITTPYISRVLGSSGVGLNSYTNSIIQYFVLIATLGVNLYGNRTVAYDRDDPDKLSQSFWEIALLRILLGMVSIGFFLMFILIHRKNVDLYWFQSIQIIATMFDISWLFVGMEDFKKTVIRNFIVKLVTTAGIFVFVKDKGDLGLYILLLSMSVLLGNLSLWGYLPKFVHIAKISFSGMRSHFLGSLELFVPQAAMQVYLVLNKTMLGSFTNVENVGYYENSDKIVKMALTIITSVAAVMIPRMANTFAKKQYQKLHRYLYQTIDFVTCMSCLLTAGLAGVAEKFSVWFMGSDFKITGLLIAVLALVCLPVSWSTVIGSQYLVTTRQTELFTKAVSIGAAVNLALNLVFIPKFSVMGAILATVISESVIAALEVWYIRKQLSVASLFNGWWKYLIGALFTYLVVKYANSVMVGSFLSFLVQAIMGALIYILIMLILHAPIINLISFFRSNRT
ncbi:flippase [Lacticaseibacillus paracasei]|uniref:flippase n=1 Tax=Lacticaseibacillus paracasei TaxID=1597 RepID=UPI000FF6428C|nr:flippase [Lacticaseibacillus paracasei]RND58159.1 putative O-antigen transporter [Lacticaseibacillus paracasei]